MASPELLCRRRTDFGPVAADLLAPPWREVEPVWLSETVSGQRPRQATWVKTAHDGSVLRVLFHCEDSEVWATHTERDSLLYEEEVVEVFLDPEGDLEAYFEIQVNPLNAVLDLALRRSRAGLKRNFAWQCEGLRTAVRLHFAPPPESAVETGAASPQTWQCVLVNDFASVQPPDLAWAIAWSAELAIPFASVSALPPKPEWRINFFRIDRPKHPAGTPRELSAWSPTLAPNFHVPEKFGTVKFE